MTRYRKIIFRLTLFFTVFVGVAVIAAFFLHSATNFSTTPQGVGARGPSSVIYDDEGEIVFSDQSLEEVERNSANDPRFGGIPLPSAKSAGIFTPLESLSLEEAERKTGIAARRARLVRFNLSNFKAAVTRMSQSGQRFVMFPLFHNVNLPIRLEAPSSYAVNTGVYWGQVVNDEQSRVRLFVEGSHMNATIETKGRVFKIMTNGGPGPEHIVLEEAPAVR